MERMEVITGMKITRERPPRKMQSIPRKIDFFDSEGKIVTSIRIYSDLGKIMVYPEKGVTVTIFNKKEQPLRIGGHNSSKWVTTGSEGDLVFPD